MMSVNFGPKSSEVREILIQNGYGQRAECHLFSSVTVGLLGAGSSAIGMGAGWAFGMVLRSNAISIISFIAGGILGTFVTWHLIKKSEANEYSRVHRINSVVHMMEGYAVNDDRRMLGEHFSKLLSLTDEKTQKLLRDSMIR